MPEYAVRIQRLNGKKPLDFMNALEAEELLRKLVGKGKDLTFGEYKIYTNHRNKDEKPFILIPLGDGWPVSELKNGKLEGKDFPYKVEVLAVE